MLATTLFYAKTCNSRLETNLCFGANEIRMEYNRLAKKLAVENSKITTQNAEAAIRRYSELFDSRVSKHLNPREVSKLRQLIGGYLIRTIPQNANNLVMPLSLEFRFSGDPTFDALQIASLTNQYPYTLSEPSNPKSWERIRLILNELKRPKETTCCWCE